MKDFKVSYTDKDEDLSHVRVQANDANGAKESARNEYWDIDEIIQVVEI